MPMRRLLFFLLVVLIEAAAPVASAQTPAPADDGIQISWEVRNRFRLFREERDFGLHVDAMAGRSILGAEDALEIQSDGRGWARNAVGRLCIDMAGHINNPCIRDGVQENYLTPADHPVTVRLTGAIPVGAVCAWSFAADDEQPAQTTLDCGEPINLRVRYGKTTTATVDITSGDGNAPQHLLEQIAVRDILIAGLGDSIGSGEGNPDRPVALADDGFCFRSYLDGSFGQYYRPSRANFKGGRACEAVDTSNAAIQGWLRLGAQWFNAACHRSLYSYQTQAALALAVQHTHIAVTYLPLACSGATIDEGLLGSQRAKECLFTKTSMNCEGSVGAQVSELSNALAAAQKRQPGRQLDLIFLSVGANDIDFSGLVANVIVDSAKERTLFRRIGMIGSLDNSRAKLARELPGNFRKLRAALKPLVGNDLSRVVFVSYGNPAMAADAPCPGGLGGFDIHPAFNADPKRLADTSAFVENDFLPQIKNLALCTGGALCEAGGAMSFVDQHQASFRQHGFCARGPVDPAFDQQCFLPDGGSFVKDIVAAAGNPMTCGQGASSFRSYLPRARWIRDANDSYFAAMTYPLATRSSNQPADIHDATWGVLSAVYGGAIHPTAEGQAAMADAALPVATSVLGLGANVAPVNSEPITPLAPRQQ